MFRYYIQQSKFLILLATILCTPQIFASDVPLKERPQTIENIKPQSHYQHEFFLGYLGVYGSAEYRFIFKDTDTLSWYAAAGADASSSGRETYHVTGGVRYSPSENVNLYAGVGGLSFMTNRAEQSGPIVEFKITQKSNSFLDVQWFGLGFGPNSWYLQCLGAVFKF
ncbi:MAG: hypothetical protein KA436_03455 [Oligoflexales bacterium]|nr:hypothetical protein [Oligoflexales bacterium]